MPPKSRKRLSGNDSELNVAPDSKKKKVEEKTPVKNAKKRNSKIDAISTPSFSNKKKACSSSTKVSPKTPDKPSKKINIEKAAEEMELNLPVKDVNEMDIGQLLALGENLKGTDFVGKSSESDFTDSDEGEDFEEVKPSERDPEIPKEGVNIVLEMPHLMKKKKHSGIDPETHIRRELNKVKRGIQLLMHKVHVLCWIAHLKYINKVINSPVMMKSCNALIKSKNLYPPKYSDLSYLEGILKWFHKTFELESGIQDQPKGTGGIMNELLHQIENKKAYSLKNFVFIFITLLRVLGLKVRIVMSFLVVPMKPPASELLDSKTIKEAVEQKSKKFPEQVTENLIDIKGETKNESTSSGKLQTSEESSGRSIKSGSKANKSVSTEAKENKRNSLKNNTVAPDNNGTDKKKGGRPSKTSKPDVKKEIKKGEKLLPKDSPRDNNSDDENDDKNFKPESLKKNREKKSIRQSISPKEEPPVRKKTEYGDVWAEVFVEDEEKWISVDVPKQKIHCVNELYSKATHPVLYVIACNNDSTLKDVTKRYVPHWHSDTRKKRVEEEWWNETMKPYLPANTAQDREEDEEINRQLQDQPMPAIISEYKDHPLYALKRHLLKFEALYPPDAPTLGFIRGEPIYARECVHTLHSREMWYKQARVVRLKEEPYKIVKARPKYDKMTGDIKKDLPLELFGVWQTEDYIPPVAVDGKVPRNEYGNVDLFKPCMLPIGTVHLQIPALNKVAKKLGIDCAPATVGFDFHSGGSHPVFDGFVVCEEFKDILLDHWNKEIDESAKKNEEKKEKRVYGNWKRLIRGLLIREKLKFKYAFGEQSQGEEFVQKIESVSSTSSAHPKTH